MDSLLTAKVAIQSHNQIGEGPVWDAARRRLLWVDHSAGSIHQARRNEAGEWQEAGRMNLARPIAAALPRINGGLIVAGGTEVFMLDEAGRSEPFACIEADPVRVRFNDAKCDPQGRVWAGTLTTDFRPGGATLYRIDADGTVTAMLNGVTLANGFDWSPDGSTFYFIDSLRFAVDAFDFDPHNGVIANPRTLVMIDPVDGGPNGMTVDREGCLWVALTGGGEVRRFAPDGSLLARVKIAVPAATSCAFGGDGCDELFITSRSGRLPDIVGRQGVPETGMESSGPLAGALYICRPGAVGIPATPFAL